MHGDTVCHCIYVQVTVVHLVHTKQVELSGGFFKMNKWIEMELTLPYLCCRYYYFHFGVGVWLSASNHVYIVIVYIVYTLTHFITCIKIVIMMPFKSAKLRTQFNALEHFISFRLKISFSVVVTTQSFHHLIIFRHETQAQTNKCF